MSASRISRREFGVGAFASLVMSACSPSGGPEGQPTNTSAPQPVGGGGQAKPVVRLIGAFTFHHAGTAAAYSFDSHDHPHEPVLIVETSLITEGAQHFRAVDKDTVARLKKVHKSFDPSRSYSAACLSNHRVRVDAGAGQRAIEHLPAITAIASRANGGMPYEADIEELRRSKLTVEFGTGELGMGEQSEAPGREKDWQFRLNGAGVSDARKLTDVTDYITDQAELSVSAAGATPIVVRSKGSNDVVYIINLATTVGDKTPNHLEHTAHYFTYVKGQNGKPVNKPSAHCVQNDLPVGEGKPLSISCGVRLVQFNPPDTEFCIQMKI